jgi:MoaA/NifB/PqqE/SkfB family radical SAM enzyme
MYQYEDIKNVHLELTERCQAECLHCFRFKDDKINPYLKMSELSLEDIKHLMPVDFLSQLNTIELKGNYGDAIIAKDCLPIIEYFRKSNPSLNIILVTNAGARNSSWWEELARLIGKNGYVIFSVDGLEDTNHIYRRNIKWDIVLNSMKSFIGAKGIAQWDFLIFEHNEHQLKEASALSKELGFDNIRFKRSARFSLFDHLPPTVYPAKNDSLINEQLKISKEKN